ncbi:FAD-binding oxidoreductase [Bizionia gelidisalsuginis]|uniref:FAD-binding oxidoreductase n=1 Tax=Bizionia gelidisalsuginis TaxID=291188 RepID=A0ABY3MAP5_9FLAO|nr:FAD-dependent oxidoreductase [Bizionia gelidisalsuginis]TYC12741.1 FAD-binding oxidoreductase [Bizionia gelidisalsuginis]
MNVDYIIVGCGLAGISFCEQLIANNKSFVVMNNHSQQASLVAGGVYNPVVLKRFSVVWKSVEQLAVALPMYKAIEKRLDIKLDYKIPVYRRFTSLEEQNDWYAASDQLELSRFMSTTLQKNTNASVNADFGFGEVLETGRIDTNVLIDSYTQDLKANAQLLEETFDFEGLTINTSAVSYKNITAKHIVFAEGYGVVNNIFFPRVSLKEAKGELLTIHAPALKIDYILKASVFIIPKGNDLYTVGSTYNWTDKTNAVTETAKEQLLSKLKPLINCPFKVVEQSAGIRPTVSNRRPIIGSHPEYKNVHIINGLGTRGVLIGPYVAEKLYEAIENKGAIAQEIDYLRFIS